MSKKCVNSSPRLVKCSAQTLSVTSSQISPADSVSSKWQPKSRRLTRLSASMERSSVDANLLSTSPGPRRRRALAAAAVTAAAVAASGKENRAGKRTLLKTLWPSRVIREGLFIFGDVDGASFPTKFRNWRCSLKTKILLAVTCVVLALAAIPVMAQQPTQHPPTATPQDPMNQMKSEGDAEVIATLIAIDRGEVAVAKAALEKN